MSINHGLLNEKYVQNFDLVPIGEMVVSEMVMELHYYKTYFRKYHGRDKYYVLMRNFVAKKLRLAGYSLQEIATVFGLANHTTIKNVIENFTPPADHKEFLLKNFDRYIKEFIYPISIKHRDHHKDRSYREVKIEGNVEIIKTKKNNAEKKQTQKFQSKNKGLPNVI